MKHKLAALVICFGINSVFAAPPFIGDITSAPAKKVLQMVEEFKAGKSDMVKKYIVMPENKNKQRIVEEDIRKLSKEFAEGNLQYKLIDSRINGRWAMVAIGVDRDLKKENEMVRSSWLRNEVLYKDGDTWLIIPQAARYRDPRVEGWKNENFNKIMDWWRYEIRAKINNNFPQKQRALEQAQKSAKKHQAKGAE
ncbi:MAG: hypothetical protein D6B27_04250 [Gammaproteobacteria bacterium]|nr:MAG: hypothetical protein D6B27_04250 [Gammaproteobacteria bacterium]